MTNNDGNIIHKKEIGINNKRYEFIIAYSPTDCSIQAIFDTYEPENKCWYKEALAHKHGEGAKYGDIVGWNNHFWCSVRANNAKEAFDIFIEKFRTWRRKTHE